MEEEKFWDNLAEKLKDVSFKVGLYESCALREVGEIRGKRVLDCGVGAGKSSMLLAQNGAKVFGFDISLSMLNMAKKGVEAVRQLTDAPTFFKMKAENLGFESEQFDIVFGLHILHHTHILESIPEIARVLKKGGKGVFVENFGFNPLLNFSRNHIAGRFGVPKYGTLEEHPLKWKDLSIIRSHFKEVKLTAPDFLFMRLLARQVFRFRFRAINLGCDFFDRWIYQGFPALSRYSYTQLLVLEK